MLPSEHAAIGDGVHWAAVNPMAEQCVSKQFPEVTFPIPV